MNKLSKPKVVSKKLLIPFVLVTSLFVLWGFANAVTDPMVQAFKKVLELIKFSSSLGTNGILWRVFLYGITRCYVYEKIFV